MTDPVLARSRAGLIAMLSGVLVAYAIDDYQGWISVVLIVLWTVNIIGWTGLWWMERGQ